jgi:crotonobetainyl-CoA:carnitine CoA-transferase CaiB-like acyl-CoA transferase
MATRNARNAAISVAARLDGALLRVQAEDPRRVGRGDVHEPGERHPALDHELRERHRAGASRLTLLADVASNHFASGREAAHFGNGHPSIVPCRTYPTRAGTAALAVANDAQFGRFAAAMAHPEWATGPRLVTNSARVGNRELAGRLVEEAPAGDTADAWISRLRAVAVPCGAPAPSRTRSPIPRRSRGRWCRRSTTRRRGLSDRPAFRSRWRGPRPGPAATTDLGQHTEQILCELGLQAAEISRSGTTG